MTVEGQLRKVCSDGFLKQIKNLMNEMEQWYRRQEKMARQLGEGLKMARTLVDHADKILRDADSSRSRRIDGRRDRDRRRKRRRGIPPPTSPPHQSTLERNRKSTSSWQSTKEVAGDDDSTPVVSSPSEPNRHASEVVDRCISDSDRKRSATGGESIEDISDADGFESKEPRTRRSCHNPPAAALPPPAPPRIHRDEATSQSNKKRRGNGTDKAKSTRQPLPALDTTEASSSRHSKQQSTPSAHTSMSKDERAVRAPSVQSVRTKVGTLYPSWVEEKAKRNPDLKPTPE
jgi:hypothetical protein